MANKIQLPGSLPEPEELQGDPIDRAYAEGLLMGIQAALGAVEAAQSKAAGRPFNPNNVKNGTMTVWAACMVEPPKG